MYVQRQFRTLFEKLASLFKIVVMVGPRQSGKTTFLKHEMGMQENAIYLNMDDPDLRIAFDEDIKKFEQLYISGKKLVILDEIQNAREPGIKLKYLADKGYKFWVTSSSNALLDANILAFLVGRTGIISAYPFSLLETMNAKSITDHSGIILDRIINEMMVFGGYPEVVMTDDVEKKMLILQNLYTTTMLKEAVANSPAVDHLPLERLGKYLSHNCGAIFSLETTSKALGIPTQSLKRYLDVIERSNLIIRVLPFFRNKNKELVKQPKIYYIDTGLRNAVANEYPVRIEQIGGMLFETFVLSELLKAGFTPKFWRSKGKAEVDFVIEKGSELVPIEVKFHSDQEVVGKSMYSFIDEYTPKNAFVVFYNGEQAEKRREGTLIRFVNVITLMEELKK